jgi:hypothetical protein
MPTETEHTDSGRADSKHDDLRGLRIDHSLRDGGGEPPAWSRRFILGGIAVVVLLGIVALAYRALASETPEVEVARALPKAVTPPAAPYSRPADTSSPITKSA